MRPGHNGQVDPYAILGLTPGAQEPAVTAAYRQAAKRWHPDRAPGEEAQRRMAEINAAYDLLRDGLAAQLPQAPTPGGARERRQGGGSGLSQLALWLEPEVRSALAPEMLSVLHDHEPVFYVASSSLWSSPEALLAVTDRRLLWLPGHAINPRVHGLLYGTIDQVEVRLRRPRRRVATLRVQAVNGRGFSFGELRPALARAIARHVAEHARAAD